MPISEQVVCAFLRPAFHFTARDDNAAIRKTLLFADLIVCPVGRVKLRQDVPTTGVASVRKGIDAALG